MHERKKCLDAKLQEQHRCQESCKIKILLYAQPLSSRERAFENLPFLTLRAGISDTGLEYLAGNHKVPSSVLVWVFLN